ncbi:MAG: phosphoribosylaminoimidazolesuccinocarboxamide synthase [Proteobacteria bacterium]|nr:phosphoribosylaminoimidazolesuccinocarboxamide synthase [Pseudomonadota bacterium]
MEKREKLYEGKAKIIHATDNPDLIIQYFKDDATAFNAEKKGSIESKGIMNNKISEVLFKYLEENGIPTHFVERLSDREMLNKKLDIVLVEVVARNIVAGSLAKRLGKDEGELLPAPIVEYYYKDDALGDPMINMDHIRILGLATDEEMAKITEYARRINGLLKKFFDKRNIDLVDFKLEFGRHNGEILLGDEICPDTCRLWDKTTGEKMDKDRFRRDMGKIEEAYAEVCKRVCGEQTSIPIF